MAQLLYPPSVNALQKQLNANYTASDAVITLNNTTNIQNKPGVCVINRVDTNGTRQASANWTYIEYTGTSGSTLTGCTAISGDQDQALGKVVEFVSDVTAQQRILDAMANLVVIGTGAVDTTKLVTPTTLNTAITSTYKATAAEVATGTEDAKIVTPLAAAPYANSSMSRQAIMNGNFDVWQRGTSLSLVDVTLQPLADRWIDYVDKNGGTLPTLTRSRQAFTAGELANAYYFTRLTTNGAGTSLGVSSEGRMVERIEHGTRLLCGNGKTVTISFWARSDIANKKITPTLIQKYGTGGSPTAEEPIKGTPITLTSTLTKYTVTFTTNTLTGKTFGTANDDYLELDFWYMWGTTKGNTYVQTSVAAETFVGSGNIDIAQVQLCAGNVALPFQPKSFEEELRSCQRYYEKSYDVGTALGTSTEYGAVITVSPTTGGFIPVDFRVRKRTDATVTFYSTTGASGKYRDLTSGADFSVSSGTVGSEMGTRAELASHGSADELIGFHWTAEAEL